MKNGLLRQMCLLLVFFLMAGCLITGCTKTPSSTDGTTSAVSTTTGTTASTIDTPTETTAIYPVKTDVTLKMLMWLPSSVSNKFDNLGKTEFHKERTELTGINVEYICALTTEAMNVLVASNEPADMIQWHFSSYPGGLEKAYQDKLIITLNDVKEYAPNYFNFLKDNPKIDKMIKSADGLYYEFPYIFPDAASDYGFMVRKDWLDDLGMGVPETIEEWYQALKAFKDKKGAVAPLTVLYPDQFFLKNNYFAGAFGTSNDFFVRNDKVEFGPIMPEFKTFLETMSEWFKEGLIDQDFVTIKPVVSNARMVNGQSGAISAYSDKIAVYNNQGQENDPKYSLAAAPVPVLNKGDEAMLGFWRPKYSRTGSCAVITNSSKNKELAARFLDWNYGEEGTILNNYGVKDKSYTVSSDGTINYTKMMHETEGWVLAEMEGNWNNNHDPAPFIKLLRAQEIRSPLKYADLFIEAFKLWRAPGTEKYCIQDLSLLGLPSDKVSAANSIMVDIKTKREEMCYKFLIGDLTVDDKNIEQFVNEMKRIGIDKVLEAYQEGYDKSK